RGSPPGGGPRPGARRPAHAGDVRCARAHPAGVRHAGHRGRVHPHPAARRRERVERAGGAARIGGWSGTLILSPTRKVPVPDPDRLVHIVDDVPELAGVTELAMVLVLDGFLDAGNAAAIASRHLVEQSGGGRVVATFEVDEFHDYRARRPAMSFVRDHYEHYAAPRLVVRLLGDASGAPYLLLHGPEPDNRWEAFAGAVREVVERFGVHRVIGMGAVPMAVPHT